MITLADMLPILGMVVGASVGVALGLGDNPAWIFLGAPAGGVAGYYLGCIPRRLSIRHERAKLAALSVGDLKAELHNLSEGRFGRFTPNYLLMELIARGQQVSEHVGLVLNLLESEGQFSRMLGFGALLSAYPDLARQLHKYNPGQSTGECKMKVAELRQIIQSAAASSRGAPRPRSPK